jgi:serine/threonine protein kinase
MLFVSNTDASSEDPEIRSRGYVEIFLFLALCLACIVVWNIPKKAKWNKKEIRKLQEQAASKPKVERLETYPTMEKAASRLREIATQFDDPRLEIFFTMSHLLVSKSTNSRTTGGMGTLRIGRSKFAVQYVNPRSRTREPQKIVKSWATVIGAAPNQFELYLKESVLEFKPQNIEDHLVLSSFWQLFSTEFTSSPIELAQPGNSNLGHKLRTVAQYIDENKKVIFDSKGAIDVDKIQFDVKSKEKNKIEKLTMPDVGSKIEGYVLSRQLGEGGFGKVFEAVNSKDKNQKMAFKFMKIPKHVVDRVGQVKPGSPEYHRLAAKFVLEAKTSLNFASKAYVMSARDYGMEPWPWIAFPLAGGSVQGLIEAGKIDEKMWWNLAHDLLSGLMSIHDEGLIHLDIKPDNLLQMDDRFIILDLGLAHTKRYEYQLGGTPGFQAPEVLAMVDGDSAVASIPFEADLYSAGVTLLWAALSGNFRRLLLGLEQPELLTLLENAKIPKNAQDLVARMMNQSPKKRGSASELLFLVKDHIDIEQKINQIELASRIYDRDAAENLEGGERAILDKKIKGPLSSWAFIEEELRVLLQDVKPAFFAFNLKLSGPTKRLYFQALYVGGGWVLECESDQFENVKFDQRNVKKLLNLGWSAPSDSSPNFEKMLDGSDPKAMAVQFATALEQGYGISSSTIESVKITAQNENAY